MNSEESHEGLDLWQREGLLQVTVRLLVFLNELDHAHALVLRQVANDWPDDFDPPSEC